MRSRTNHTPTYTHPYVIRSCELSEISNEEPGHHTPPYPLYVIRSCELSEMSNKEQDTPPPPYPSYVIQELWVKWDEQWGAGHLNPTLPILCH